MFPKAVEADHHVSAPRAFRAQPAAPTGPIEPMGQVLAVNFSAVAQVVDLEAIANPPFNDLSSQQYNRTGKGVVGNFITVHAEGQDLYFIVGKTQAQVTGMAATTVGALTASGTYQGATGAAWRVPANTNFKFTPGIGVDRYMQIAASTGTGTMRLYTSNPINGQSL